MRKFERIETVILEIPTIRGHVLSTTTMMQSTVLVTARFSDGPVVSAGATIGGVSYGPGHAPAP
jgi:muconate cycloisomerase